MTYVVDYVATLDKDGYPTDEYLGVLRSWPVDAGYVGLLTLAAEGWKWEDCVDGPIRENDDLGREVIRYVFVTGGWSGNEDIIGALMGNRLFWSLCWESSQRGGRHVFMVRDSCA